MSGIPSPTPGAAGGTPAPTPSAPTGSVPAAPAPAADAGKPEGDAAPAPTEQPNSDVDVPALGADDEGAGGSADVPALGDDVEPEPADGDEQSADGDDASDGEEDGEEDGDDAPIEYEFEAPEDGPAYREPVIDAYKEVLQKHRVAPDAAKDILATMLPVLQKDSDAQVQAHIDETKAKWRQELVERHGEKLADVRRLANRMLQHATPELRAMIRDSALAENPDFNDLLAAGGQRFTNDRPPKGGKVQRGKKLSAVDAAAREYEADERG